MAWQSGGGGLVGVKTNAQGDMTVTGSVTAGQSNGVQPQYNEVNGNLQVDAWQGDLDDGDPAGNLVQHGTLAGAVGVATLLVQRVLTRNGHAATTGLLSLQDFGLDGTPPDSEPVITSNGFNTNFVGGMGRFGFPPPTAKSSITGALSTVTDAAAKAVLTSIIAALVADGGANNNTT